MPAINPDLSRYEVSPNGKRFLVLEPARRASKSMLQSGLASVAARSNRRVAMNGSVSVSVTVNGL